MYYKKPTFIPRFRRNRPWSRPTWKDYARKKTIKDFGERLIPDAGPVLEPAPRQIKDREDTMRKNLPVRYRKTRPRTYTFWKPSKPTITKYRGKRRITPIKQIGAGSSMSNYRRYYKRAYATRNLRRLAPTQTRVTISGTRLIASLGLQAVQAIFPYTNGSYSTAQQVLANALGITQNNTTSMYVQGMHMEHTFTNQCEATVKLRIMEVVPRKSTSLRADNAFSGGVIDERISPSLVPGSTSLGIEPRMSKLFTEYYRIIWTYTVELSQGRSHIHNSRHYLRQEFNNTEYVDDSAIEYMRNLTPGILCIAEGMPLNSQATNTVVNTAPVAIDVVTKCRLYATFINPTNKYISYSNSLVSFADPYIMDIGSGEPEAVNIA